MDERNARPDDVAAIAVRDLKGIVKADVLFYWQVFWKAAPSTQSLVRPYCLLS
jgi:hypothetical protein